MIERITPKEFHKSEGVDDWRIVGSDGACAYFRTRSLAESARLVAAIGGIAGIDGHRVAIDVRNDGVTVSLITFAEGYMGMSRRDVELARAISGAASSGSPRIRRRCGHPRRARHQGARVLLQYGKYDPWR